MAARTLTFVPCPHCNVVDKSALSYRVQATIGAIVVGIVVAVLAWFFAQMKIRDHADAEVARWVGYSFGALATIIAYAMWRRPWVGVNAGSRST